MRKDILIKCRGGSSSTKTVELPNICPHCGQTMTPDTYYAVSNDSNTDPNLKFGILARCTAKGCTNFFSLEYTSSYEQTYLLIYTYRPPIFTDLPQNIEKVSLNFVDIYSQAIKAESENLDQIAGVGYRKSLEFLIKDYAIYSNPGDADTV